MLNLDNISFKSIAIAALSLSGGVLGSGSFSGARGRNSIEALTTITPSITGTTLVESRGHLQKKVSTQGGCTYTNTGGRNMLVGDQLGKLHVLTPSGERVCTPYHDQAGTYLPLQELEAYTSRTGQINGVNVMLHPALSNPEGGTYPLSLENTKGSTKWLSVGGKTIKLKPSETITLSRDFANKELRVSDNKPSGIGKPLQFSGYDGGKKMYDMQN